MTTQAIKNAILAEMQGGKSLLEARLIVQNYIMDRIEVATSELRTQLKGDK